MWSLAGRAATGCGCTPACASSTPPTSTCALGACPSCPFATLDLGQSLIAGLKRKLIVQRMLVEHVTPDLQMVPRPTHMCCVRWRHPLAPDVSLIQTLAPGTELAVPVANAREGELCLQPAGELLR